MKNTLKLQSSVARHSHDHRGGQAGKAQLGQLRALAPRIKCEGPGQTGITTTDQTFILPYRLTGKALRALASALEEALSGSTRLHTIGICDCELHFARVTTLHPRRLSVRLTVSRHV